MNRTVLSVLIWLVLNGCLLEAVEDLFFYQLSSNREGHFAFRSRDGVGLMDYRGKILIPANPDIEIIGEFANGIAPARINGLWVLIDNRGSQVGATGFSAVGASKVSAGSFVVVSGNRYGIVDDNGDLLIPPQYERIVTIPGGYFWFLKGELWGLGRFDGKIVIEPTYEEVRPDGFPHGLEMVKLSGKWGFIGHAGEFIIEPMFEWALPFDGGNIVGSDGRKVSVYNLQKERIFSADMIEPMAEGLSAFRLNGRYGYIDVSGAVIIEPVFSEARPFSEGRAAVGVPKNTEIRWDYIDRSGEVVIQQHFTYAGSFQHGIALVRQGESWAIVDRVGVTRGEIEADEVKRGRWGYYYRRGQRWGYLNSRFDVIIPPRFDDVWEPSQFLEPLLKVRSGERWGLMDINGHPVRPWIGEE